MRTHFDFLEQPEMDTSVGLFYAMVEENVDRLHHLIEDVTEEELYYKGSDGDENSMAQLLNHLTYVDVRWVFRIKGEALPDSLEAEHGPMVDKDGKLPVVTSLSVQELIEKQRYVLALLKETCQALHDDDLARWIPYEEERQATIRWGLWHMADHHRYHQAHINRLRLSYAKGEMGSL
ncbi:DinB family protein [Halalkalibacterium halodurans]|uniref:BH0825 protein n=2 Tax=Halalkalibacterium halodurans TaxID=86665 RepID=Q9KEM7_HALH5|nr:DinB family protein [Halalkalibacterium halodurans]MDY7221324.1 DinB family protein [Halalkalibacterium halodurans]MDY7240563.1 DinB family protein [Halalkalibacterium halodurans]MED4081403.1 DinB family protein [Halalkalibacterium halodurans]MED4083315.1 DinB family protein [Halalkalibacterium halodurans]MED4106494.1 DinB family protein [Halalkalibacterium halodurans]